MPGLGSQGLGFIGFIGLKASGFGFRVACLGLIGLRVYRA